MLNLAHVKTFLSVLDAGGVRAAARRLCISPSTAADHLAQLEADLGAALLVRRKGGNALTDAGAALLPLARALIETAARARAVVSGAPLRLAASTNIGTYILQGPLAAFRRAHGAAVDLWIGPNPSVAERLSSGAADAAVMEWWDGRPGFRAVTWRREPMVLIVPPEHPWSEQRSVAPHALARERMLGGEAGSGTATALREALGPAFASLTTVGGYGSTEAVKRAVRAGHGVSIVLAAAVADEIAAGQLVALSVRGARLSKETRVVLPADLPPTAPSARFAGFLSGAREP